MARERIVTHRDRTPVRYPPERFALLARKRGRSRPFLDVLPDGSLLFGSLARGDVREASDIDIEVPQGVASFAVEVALSGVDDPCVGRYLVAATPNAVVKALWTFGEVTVSLPLTAPSPLEEAFTRFGGALDRRGVAEGLRVPGVDKRLLLIEPTPDGHIEASVCDRVEEAARALGVDADVVRGRVRVLRRRSESGRTGAYLTEPLDEAESPEEALERLKDGDPAVRRSASGSR
jgi:predicted nucleotidyltransferase